MKKDVVRAYDLFSLIASTSRFVLNQNLPLMFFSSQKYTYVVNELDKKSRVCFHSLVHTTRSENENPFQFRKTYIHSTQNETFRVDQAI